MPEPNTVEFTNSPERHQLSEPELTKIIENDLNYQHQVCNPDILKRFVDENVTGAKVDGVNIFSINIDHWNDTVNPVIKACIASPNTRVVVAEYSPQESKSKLTEKILNNPKMKDYKKRQEFGEKIMDVCHEAKKLVAVTDIANKPAYIIAREFFRTWLGLASTAALVATRNLLFYLPSLANADWALSLYLQLTKNSGIFSKTEVAPLERLILDFEQARRMYLTKGVEMLIKEYPSYASPGKEESQIVVLYPKAHGIRMVDQLVKPESKLFLKAKSFIYKIFGPTLDYSVRTWEWKNMLTTPGWMLTSNRKITI